MAAGAKRNVVHHRQDAKKGLDLPLIGTEPVSNSFPMKHRVGRIYAKDLSANLDTIHQVSMPPRAF